MSPLSWPQTQGLQPLKPLRLDGSPEQGYEVVSEGRRSVETAVELIEWLGQCAPERGSFYIVDAPLQMGRAAALELLGAARRAGIESRLGFACSAASLRESEAAELFMRQRIRVVLDDAGPQTRFADLALRGLSAIRLSASLVYELGGDPVAGALLDGMLCVSASLGLCSIASRVPHDADLDSLAACGVDYASMAGPGVNPIDVESRWTPLHGHLN
jgi:EAL domain-containing protein (putative c-di-GMP-specific phosphodiesterase class I)